MNYLGDLSNYLSDRKINHLIVNENLYREYNHMIIPNGPVVKDYSLNKDEISRLFSKLNGILIKDTKLAGTNVKVNDEFAWYAIICDKFIDKKDLKSKYRSEINRGLNNCSVRRITANELNDVGFDVHKKALVGYGQNVKEDAHEKFSQMLEIASNYDKLIHFWGCFDQENKLIAYAQNYIYDSIEVFYSTMKFDPEYLSLYPSYALIYTMNEYYLKGLGVKYVNDGFRSLYHKTNIQSYLVKKFNFKPLYLNLNMKYRAPYNLLVNFIYPFRKAIHGKNLKMDALLQQEAIARNGII